jgi:hypothetical protein
VLAFAANQALAAVVSIGLVVLPVTAWLLGRWAYPWWCESRERRIVARANRRGLIDGAFSDAELIDLCRSDLAAITGERTLEDLSGLEPLFGDGPKMWAATHWRTTTWGDRDESATCSVDLLLCDVIRVLSHGQDGPRRVVVRVEAKIVVPGSLGVDHHHKFEAFWTMTKLDRGWARVAVEGRWDGRRHLNQDPLEDPDADVGYLRESAVMELAAESSSRQELIRATGDVLGRRRAHAAALDLSQVDARFGVDVIESCVRRILGGWEAATNGQPGALDGLAQPRAAHQVLSQPRGWPSVIREPQLRKLTLIEVDASASPSTITFLGSVRAHPDIWHLDICWRLRLGDDPQQPWILEDPMAWKNVYSYAGK